MTTRPVTSSGVVEAGAVAVWSLDAQAIPAPANTRARDLAALVQGDQVRTRIAAAANELRSAGTAYVQWEEFAELDEPRQFLFGLAPVRERHTVTGFALTATDVSALHRLSTALCDAGAAIGRAPDLTRLLQEVAQQSRRLFRSEAIAIRLGEQADGRPLAYLAGYDDESSAARKVDAVRREKPAVVGRGEGWFEIAVSLRSGDRVHGALIIRVAESKTPGEEAIALEVLGAFAGFLCAALDRMERARSADHRLRVEAGGEMATAIGHSLRHALYGISSAAQLLRFRASDDPVLEKNVGRLLREADRVARLVDALLDFGRPVTLELEAADPDQTWDDVIHAHRGQLESRSLAVSRTRGAPGGARPVDVRRLTQAFALLLEGAAERAPEATDLELVSEVIAGGAWRSKLTFAGSVEPAELQRFFDPLANPNSGQSGVSLALSRRIVDAHGGSLAVDSDPARGTTLTVLLPP